MNVHFIAIGGSAMHNLAIALHKKGYSVTGSDDEIFEPSRGRLRNLGLLPATEGWNSNCVHSDLDAVILGMHAKSDNPELIKARELGLKIFSYPEFLYEQSKHKTRIVIGGSHGKTTITAMILHVMNLCGIDTDYMVGAQLAGFDVMVKLSENAPFMVLEGDEYLSSALDPRPKFHLYKPNIALLSGIAWDHMNVFPTFENYLKQFQIFLNGIEPNGSIVYCSEDAEVNQMVEDSNLAIKKIPYGIPAFTIDNGVTKIITELDDYPIKVFGKHNLQNINGARLVCNEIGISDLDFYTAIQSFKGASKRLELIGENARSAVYKDFAHSPSKLKATTQAMKEQFLGRQLVACIELHTYSSLNQKFLDQYRGCMASVDVPIVYFSPHALQLKRLPQLTENQIRFAFDENRLVIFNDAENLNTFLIDQNWENKNLLMMSSGNFDGMNLEKLVQKIIKPGA